MWARDGPAAMLRPMQDVLTITNLSKTYANGVHALDLARRGAKVVINDLGGTVDGSGGSSDAAKKVVEEITAFGGAANIREFQETEIIIAPSIKTEGKLFQTVQSVGMGTR